MEEKFEMEIKKHTEEAASKVAAVLQRAEEQGHMIESLHSSVAMYKRLYEEEHKHHLASSRPSNLAPADRRADLLLLVDGSQEARKKAQEKAVERVKCLEEELEKSRRKIIALRSERDKFALEANFAREKLDGVMKEADHQEELVKVRVEAQANKEHMLQYKSIAEVNEATLKQMESSHESFKIEAEKLKDTLEAELLSLGERVSLLENEFVMKSKEVASATAGHEEALASAFAEITTLKEEVCVKRSDWFVIWWMLEKCGRVSTFEHK